MKNSRRGLGSKASKEECMAKDDYDYIVFKILTYLYACMKRKSSFDERVFKQSIITQKVTEEYATDILRAMSNEGLIEGVVFTKAWGDTYILASELSDMKITSDGMRYVINNDKMKSIKQKILIVSNDL